MSANEQKKRVIEDLRSKRHSYYTRAYGTSTKENFLRQLRNTLINKALLEIENCDNVLDAGCGPAILYDELLKKCGTYHAVDLVDTNLEEIRAKHATGKIKYVLSDLDHFTWQPGYFDVIICSGSLEYTLDPTANLQRLIGFLKSGGTLIATFPNIKSPYRLWGELVYKHLWYLKRKITGEKAFIYRRALLSGRHIEKLCHDAAGIRTVSMMYFGHKMIPQPFDRALGALDYRISQYLNGKRFEWLDWAATEFLVMLKK